MPKTRKKLVSNCETCMYYDYDDDYEAYICTANLDEDDLERFVKGANTHCPYYRFLSSPSMSFLPGFSSQKLILPPMGFTRMLGVRAPMEMVL